MPFFPTLTRFPGSKLGREGGKLGRCDSAVDNYQVINHLIIESPNLKPPLTWRPGFAVTHLCFCGLQDSPPPNSYNLSQTFGKGGGRSCLQPRSEGAKMRQSCFLSAAPRANVFPLCDPSLPGTDTQTAQKRLQWCRSTI